MRGFTDFGYVLIVMHSSYGAGSAKMVLAFEEFTLMPILLDGYSPTTITGFCARSSLRATMSLPPVTCCKKVTGFSITRTQFKSNAKLCAQRCVLTHSCNSSWIAMEPNSRRCIRRNRREHAIAPSTSPGRVTPSMLCRSLSSDRRWLCMCAHSRSIS